MIEKYREIHLLVDSMLDQDHCLYRGSDFTNAISLLVHGLA